MNFGEFVRCFVGDAPNQSTTTFRKARVPEDSTSYATMLAGGCYRPPDVMVTHNWSNKYLHLMAAIFSEVRMWFFLYGKAVVVVQLVVTLRFFFVDQDSRGGPYFWEFFLGGGERRGNATSP